MFKKILYWVIGIAIAILVALLLIGWMNPRYEDTVQVTIDAPIEKTWALFDDLDNMKEWVPGYLGHEVLEGDTQTPGSKYRLDFNMDGREFSMVETVTNYDPGKAFAFDVEDESGATFNIAVELEEKGEKTIVKETMTGEPKGIFDRAMTTLMKGQIRKHKLKMYNDLKAFVERTEWTPAPPEKINAGSIPVDTMLNNTGK